MEPDTALMDSLAQLTEEPIKLPSLIQLYGMGVALYSAKDRADNATNKMMWDAYNRLLIIIPRDYARAKLSTLNSGYAQMLNDGNSSISSSTKNRSLDSIVHATMAMCGLYLHSPTACRLGFSTDLCRQLSEAYDLLHQDKQQQQDKGEDTKNLLKDILSVVGGLLGDGVLSDPSRSEEEKLNTMLGTVQAMTEDDKNTCLGDLIVSGATNTSNKSVTQRVRDELTESTQRDYLLLMMDSSTKGVETVGKNKAKATSRVGNTTAMPSAPTTKAVNPREEIERRIQQVKDVLPDLGDGYVETALSSYQGDVSQTVAALLEGESNPASLPSALRMIDKKLPGRKREPSVLTKQDDEEARRVAKERVAAMEKREEAEAYALAALNNEYNDDYDDQYDELDGGAKLGGTGGTYDDVDLSTIRTYNRVARASEQESAFWEDSRNRNREGKAGRGGGGGGGGGAKKFGPDKIKGGRVVDADGKVVQRQKGGKKGRQQKANAAAAAKADAPTRGPEASANMSKIQKRRKNDNKAKVGNHNRKDRAQKKAAAGM